MRVLFVTWEFPPLIAGGLGTACYGMVRALLRAGVEVDLILPTIQETVFPMREEEDVDTLPVRVLEESPEVRTLIETHTETKARLEYLGLSARPETYLTPGFIMGGFWRRYEWTETITRARLLQTLAENLIGGENIFQKVQELTVRAASLAEKLEFDVIHAHDWLTFPAGLVLRQLSGKPLVAHIHATEFDRAGGAGDERVHKIEYASLSQADLILAVSRYTAEMVAGRYRIDSDKISVVHNAHSIEAEEKLSEERIFKGPLILFLGRITLQKGPDYFLEVATRVLKAHPEARFVMAGTGDMMSRVMHRSAAARLGPKFLFTDFLNRRQVDQVLKASDIFIMPSVSEPFGIVPLEAMAHGAASVISKQSGVAEVLENVIKVDFWDIDEMVRVVNRLIENPEERLALAKAGHDEVLEIKWDEAAHKIRHAYTKVIDEG